METQFAVSEETLQPRNELAAEHFAEHSYGQKEPGGCMDPMRSIRRDTTCRNDTVDVRMMLQILSPGVQHAEKADLSSEVFRISGDLD